MNKDEILDAIQEECSRLNILEAVYNHYKKSVDIIKIEQCRDAIEVSLEKLLELDTKFKELEKKEVQL
tara:strand:+ start:451 stop:654 length:204 start_codon:yes stop_codon:yes gene_type:complete